MESVSVFVTEVAMVSETPMESVTSFDDWGVAIVSEMPIESEMFLMNVVLRVSETPMESVSVFVTDNSIKSVIAVTPSSIWQVSLSPEPPVVGHPVNVAGSFATYQDLASTKTKSSSLILMGPRSYRLGKTNGTE